MPGSFEEAEFSPRLLGFEMDHSSIDDLSESDDETFADIEAAACDETLAEKLHRATQGRIEREILSPAGLYAVRTLAARVLAASEYNRDVPFTPAGALNFLLEEIDKRIGQRPGEWLNALSLIAKRLLAENFSGGMDKLYRAVK